MGDQVAPRPGIRSAPGRAWAGLRYPRGTSVTAEGREHCRRVPWVARHSGTSPHWRLRVRMDFVNLRKGRLTSATPIGGQSSDLLTSQQLPVVQCRIAMGGVPNGKPASTAGKRRDHRIKQDFNERE